LLEVSVRPQEETGSGAAYEAVAPAVEARHMRHSLESHTYPDAVVQAAERHVQSKLVATAPTHWAEGLQVLQRTDPRWAAAWVEWAPEMGIVDTLVVEQDNLLEGTEALQMAGVEDMHTGSDLDWVGVGY
jgi:hypothetical protein